MVDKIKAAKAEMMDEVGKQLKKSVIYAGREGLIDGMEYKRGDIVFKDVLKIDVDDVVIAISNLIDYSKIEIDEFGIITRNAMIEVFKAEARLLYSSIATLKPNG